MSFEQITPGIFVNKASGLKVKIPHPDPCWLLLNPEGIIITNGTTKAIPIFSTEELANQFVTAVNIDAKPREFTWDDFVDYMNELANRGEFQAILDHRGEDGYYTIIPIRKEI